MLELLGLAVANGLLAVPVLYPFLRDPRPRLRAPHALPAVSMAAGADYVGMV